MAKKKTSPGLDLIPGMLPQSYRSTKKELDAPLKLRYEVLARWAVESWNERYPDTPYMVLWASENCGNNLARQRLKVGRKLKGKANYRGNEMIDCPHVMPISDYRLPGRTAVLAETVGAFLFHFTNDK